jgi:hypothetical protein
MQSLQLETHNQIQRYIKYEAGWILTNIAYGDEDDFIHFFKNPSFVGIFNQIMNRPDYDIVLVD